MASTRKSAPAGKAPSAPKDKQKRGSSAVAERRVHTPEVAGSTPAPATSSSAALRDQIKLAAQHGHRYYVYTLADADGVFYVGKGCRNRVISHGTASDRVNPGKSLRLAKSGSAVQRMVLAYFRGERDALDLERSLIAEHREMLTNIASGGLPQNPKEKASAIAAAMLARLKDRRQVAPELLATYDRIRAEMEKQVADPAPTSITIDSTGRILAQGYSEDHYAIKPQAKEAVSL